MEKAKDSSPPQSGGEVSRAQPGTERGTDLPARRSPSAVARARSLRRGDNLTEAVLWNELKAKRLGGYKFVRQMPLGPYFADFCCRDCRLVVELDGSQHADSNYDRHRDAFMRAQSYSVLRFWNGDVLKHTTSVCETILAVLEGRLAAETVATDIRFVKAEAKESAG